MANWPAIPQTYVLQNRYLVGKGADAVYRLNVEWGKVVFSLWAQSQAGNAPLSGKDFQTEFCLPALRAMAWQKAQVRVFGVVATGYPAFARGCEYLASDRGRRQILAWMRDSELAKLPNFGVAELTALVAEMHQTKAGTHKGAAAAASAGTGGTGAGESAGEAPADETAGALGGAREEGDASASEGEDGAAGARHDPGAEDDAALLDPVLEKAQHLADSELQSVSQHEDLQAWRAECQAFLMQSTRAALYLNCETSRVQVVHTFLDAAAAVQGSPPLHLLRHAHRVSFQLRAGSAYPLPY